MDQPTCAKCGKPIELDQPFVRTAYDEAGKMVVVHAEENTDTALRVRKMTPGRVWAIENYVAPPGQRG